jgi:hypothetical protein
MFTIVLPMVTATLTCIVGLQSLIDGAGSVARSDAVKQYALPRVLLAYVGLLPLIQYDVIFSHVISHSLVIHSTSASNLHRFF